MLAGIAGAYALNPFDPSPNYKPGLWYLDDLLVIASAIWLAVCLIPDSLMQELREDARRRLEEPQSRLGAFTLGLFWFVAAVVLICIVWKRLG